MPPPLPMAVRLAAGPQSEHLQAASMPIDQAATPCNLRAYSLGWDRQSDRQTDERIVISLNAPLWWGT